MTDRDHIQPVSRWWFAALLLSLLLWFVLCGIMAAVWNG